MEEPLAERGIEVDHVTIYRWVQRLTPMLIDAARPCRHAVGGRWLVDATSVKVAGKWRDVCGVKPIAPPQSTKSPPASDPKRPLPTFSRVPPSNNATVPVDVLANDPDMDGVLDPSSLRIVAAGQLGEATVAGTRIRYLAGDVEGVDEVP